MYLMAVLKEFRTEQEKIQQEHCQVMARLAQLDRALEALVCHSEVYADFAALARVREAALWLCDWLPSHFVHEEGGVLELLAQRGPEFAAFVREMKRQHFEIVARVNLLCERTADFDTCADLEEAVCALKQTGKELTSFMAAHMGTEERKFAAVK